MWGRLRGYTCLSLFFWERLRGYTDEGGCSVLFLFFGGGALDGLEAKGKPMAMPQNLGPPPKPFRLHYPKKGKNPTKAQDTASFREDSSKRKRPKGCGSRHGTKTITLVVIQYARSRSSALLPPFFGEGSPTKVDYRKKGTLILSSLLEDLFILEQRSKDENSRFILSHHPGPKILSHTHVQSKTLLYLDSMDPQKHHVEASFNKQQLPSHDDVKIVGLLFFMLFPQVSHALKTRVSEDHPSHLLLRISACLVLCVVVGRPFLYRVLIVTQIMLWYVFSESLRGGWSKGGFPKKLPILLAPTPPKYSIAFGIPFDETMETEGPLKQLQPIILWHPKSLCHFSLCHFPCYTNHFEAIIFAAQHFAAPHFESPFRVPQGSLRFPAWTPPLRDSLKSQGWFPGRFVLFLRQGSGSGTASRRPLSRCGTGSSPSAARPSPGSARRCTRRWVQWGRGWD